MNSVILLGLSVCFSACLINALPTDMTEEEAYEYLKHFGYLPTSGANTENAEHGAMRGQPDTSAVEKALRDFQDFAGLPITGVLDAATKTTMKLPRCGVKDHNLNDKFGDFTLIGGKWSKNELTYYISGYPDTKWGLSNAEVDHQIKRAFDIWSAITPLIFTRLNSKDNVDIEIFWGSRKHRDCAYPFDGPMGTLAHAFNPEHGDAHFDDEETWTVGKHEGINLFQVAVHEFGHSLGLGHSKVKSALMGPFFRGYQPNFKLDADDISGIQSLYGGKSVKSACGSCGEFSSKSGCVTSKNYPNNYDNNVDCDITIRPVAGHEMEVKFTKFDIEADASCNYDYLEIREEGGKTSKHCGTTLPTAIATSKTLYIKFHSDDSTGGKGYKLEWTSTPRTVAPACGSCGDFSSKSGCVTSKNYPNNYDNNVDCDITIRPVAGHEMEVKFTNFDIEADGSCQYDYLEIREEGGKTSKHCGTTLPTAIATSKTLYLKFHSDDSTGRSGYKLEWTSTPRTVAPVPCGECGVFSSASGCVKSKNHPQKYPTDYECTITIQPVANQNIQLEFTDFDLEGGTCQYDYLEISEQGGQSHGKFCGDTKPGTITSSKPLYIRFVADGYDSKSGYKFKWTSVATFSAVNANGDSGNDLTGDSGDDTDDSGNDDDGGWI